MPDNEAKLELDRKLLNTETIRREKSQGGGAWNTYSPRAIYHWWYETAFLYFPSERYDRREVTGTLVSS